MLRDAIYTGITPQFWGSLDALGGPRDLGALRADELRQGPARPERARLARRARGAVPQRPGRRAAVSRALELAEAALAAAPGEEAEAVVQSELSGFARFAGSEVHQPTLVENHTRQRCASSAAAASAGRRRTGATARRSPSSRGERGPRSRWRPRIRTSPASPRRRRRPRSTATTRRRPRSSPRSRRSSPQRAIAAARPFELYGYVTSGVVELAVATSAGLAVEQRDDGCVRARARRDRRRLRLRRAAVVGASRDRGRTGPPRKPRARPTRRAAASELPPGDYRAVLEPYAFAELLEYFAFDSFSGLGLLEESSYFAGRLGKRVFASARLDRRGPARPAGLPKAIDFEGTPRRRVADRRGRRGARRGVGPRHGRARRRGVDGQRRPGRVPPLRAARPSRSRSPAAAPTRSTSSRRRSARASR